MSQHMHTPLARLQQLESQVAALTNSALNPKREDNAVAHSPNPVWSADEQLLLTCLRRFDPVMGAYVRQAEVQIDAQNNVNLMPSDQSSFYKFVVLQNGDAVVWGDLTDLSQLEGRREMLNLLYECGPNDQLLGGYQCITKLAYFVPIETGVRWAFSQKGLMVGEPSKARSKELTDQDKRAFQIRRLEKELSEQSKEIEYLKSELRVTRNETKEILHLLLHSRSS